MEARLRARCQFSRRLVCRQCGEPASFIHVETFAIAMRSTRVKVRSDRLIRGVWVCVCPECDIYALAQGSDRSVPFYSVRNEAVITIADYDRMDTVALLEFGNLPFTPRALASALVIGDQLPRRNSIDLFVLDRRLLGPTGIPENEFARAEWLRQLYGVASKLSTQINAVELDAAIRRIVRQVPNYS